MSSCAMSIDRIRKLIALSGSTNEHEARSAAYLACKMLREGSYEVVDAVYHPWTDPFAGSGWAASPARPERAPPPRRPVQDARPRRRVPCDIGRAPRSGLCVVCGEEFERGSDVASPILAADAHFGTAHADCRSLWTVPVDE